MYWAAWLLANRSGIKSLMAHAPPLETYPDLPPLPEALRTIRLPGVRYYVKDLFRPGAGQTNVLLYNGQHHDHAGHGHCGHATR